MSMNRHREGDSRWSRLAAAALLALNLTACGGGGGGGSAGGGGIGGGDAWQHQAYLKAPNAGAGDQFAYSVAISGDTLVVGAHLEDSNATVITNGSTASADNSISNAGAAYVFVRSGSSWSQQAYLKVPNTGTNDRAGLSVAISGDTIVVGAPMEDSGQTTITNGSTASADDSISDAGAAYVFVRSGTTWSQQAYLKAPNAGTLDRFGSSVAISGDTIVVGAPLESSSQTTITNGSTASSDNGAPDAGAVYVYTRSGTAWSQQAYLKAPNAQAEDEFGSSVAISGDTIVVGAPFEDSNQTSVTNGSSASNDNSASAAGAAYVFTRNGTTWSQQAFLKASNAAGSHLFGASVAVSGDTLVVGATNEGAAGNTTPGQGAAYVFTRAGVDWSQQALLKAPNADVNDSFGASVAISGDTLVVGASLEASSQTAITSSASADNSAASAGAAYVFRRIGSVWSLRAYLKAPNAGAGDTFGNSVAIGGNTIVAGSPLEDSNQTSITNGSTAGDDNSASNAGAAYVFQLAI